MAIYTIVAVDRHGGVKREYACMKRDAMFQAERLFNRGEYVQVDVFYQNKNGRVGCVHRILRHSQADIAARQADYPAPR